MNYKKSILDFKIILKNSYSKLISWTLVRISFTFGKKRIHGLRWLETQK